MPNKHRGAPLQLIKLTMMDEFGRWCKERNADQNAENMIEFLIQKDFIRGKKFLKYVDDIKISPTWFLEVPCEMLREGFIPPKAWIGMR